MKALWLAVTVACFLVPGTSFGFQLKKDGTGSPVQWRGAVRFVAQKGFDEAIEAKGALEALRQSLGAYAGQAQVPQLSVAEGETHGVGFSMQGPNQNEIVVLEEWPFNDNAIASTIVTIDRNTHAIIDADIAFNRQRNTFGVLPASSHRGGELDDVQNTMTHELGHALGLAHDMAVPEAVMYPEAFCGEVNKRTLAADDVAGLNALYPMPAATASTPSDPGTQAQGCSAAGAGPLALALMVWARSRRLYRRVLFISLMAVPFMSVAPATALRPTVVQSVTRARDGLFFTELTLSNGERAMHLGGRLGQYEQIVDDHAVPQVGETFAP